MWADTTATLYVYSLFDHSPRDKIVEKGIGIFDLISGEYSFLFVFLRIHLLLRYRYFNINIYISSNLARV